MHSLVWLAICAQLAQDEESYGFAKEVIDVQGGVPIELIRNPTIYSGFPGSEDSDPDWSELSRPGEMPQYEEWITMVKETVKGKDINVLPCLIEAFCGGELQVQTKQCKILQTSVWREQLGNQ